MFQYITGFLISLLFLSQSYAASLKVGVTAGPHDVIMEKIKDLAKTADLDIQIIVFNDLNTLNAALDSGEIDINSYQHQFFLDEQVKNRGYKIKSAGKTVLMPLGVYSQKFQSLKGIKENAKIAIPNDPTNEGRALKLLEREGLIKLTDADNPTPLDILENPHHITFIELEAPQLSRVLMDVDFAIINTDWVFLAGLDPKTALVVEDKNSSPYANVFAVRIDDNRPEITKLIKLYQSEQMKEFIKERFKGAVLPAW